mmetsp:Transcript_45714/g.97193  ORF Transcript_45714/g.97193 Transcript_45714/m.97193 type:complete len:121 (-) Transcript_45714:220-582(-)
MPSRMNNAFDGTIFGRVDGAFGAINYLSFQRARNRFFPCSELRSGCRKIPEGEHLTASDDRPSRATRCCHAWTVPGRDLAASVATRADEILPLRATQTGEISLRAYSEGYLSARVCAKEG